MIKLLVGNSKTEDISGLSISEMLYERISLFEARILKLIYGFTFHTTVSSTKYQAFHRNIFKIYTITHIFTDRGYNINYLCKSIAFKNFIRNLCRI